MTADIVEKLLQPTNTAEKNIIINGCPLSSYRSLWQKNPAQAVADLCDYIADFEAKQPTDDKPDITKCPSCGGDADNGFDRCDPPNPYACTKCEQRTTTDRAEALAALDQIGFALGYYKCLAEKAIPDLDVVDKKEYLASLDTIRAALTSAPSVIDFDKLKEPPTAVRITEYAKGYGDGYNKAIDDAKSMLAAAPQPPAPSVPQWQPIETAPENGERILAYCSRYGATTAHYVLGHDNGQGYFPTAPRWKLHSVLDPETQPTHWMPLPPAPQPEKE